MSSKTENPILIKEDKHHENAPPPPLPTISVPERPTQTPATVLMRRPTFATRNDIVPQIVYGNLVEFFLLLCMYFNISF